jgi:hypothetical protein
VSLLLIFFAIHVLRTDAKWSFIGFISPFAAVIGDTIVALVIAIALLLPLRLFWRKLTRRSKLLPGIDSRTSTNKAKSRPFWNADWTSGSATGCDLRSRCAPYATRSTMHSGAYSV